LSCGCRERSGTIVIVLLAGERARRKRHAVHGLSAAELEARLAGLGD